MNLTLSELLQFVEDNDIKFIRLAFCDMFGIPKNIAVMSSHLEHALRDGISFDASAIAGFSNVAESDLYLVPDPSTFSLLPWRPSQDCVARVYCNVCYPDGRPFEGDGRRVLTQTVERAAQKGFSFQVGPECEFYLFTTDEQGAPSLIPHDRAGYFDLAPVDRGENVRRGICLTLEEMGIRPERSHHEQGPGQNEVDFRYSSPVQAADDLMSLRAVSKAVAAQYGLFASFLPKPLSSRSGSGLHINLSLHQNGRNLFERFSAQPDPTAASFMAGILDHIAELSLFTNPLPSSYQRLGSFEAPCTISWSCQNRSQLIRVPAAKGADCRMEVRSPDPACNPYLALALLLEAGMDGIERKLALSPSSDFDAYRESQAKHLPKLPADIRSALDLAEQSEFLRRILPEKLYHNYLSQKSREVETYEGAADPDQWEFDRYFEWI